MELRPYQQAAVDAVYKHLRSKDNNPCIVLPTGTGKSVVIAKIVSDSVQQWNGRVLILAHVKELLEQNSGKVKAFCPDIPIGIFCRAEIPRHRGTGDRGRYSVRLQQGVRFRSI